MRNISMENIYYRIGDKPIKKLDFFTPLTRVFCKEDMKYDQLRIKDEVTYIHFDKALGDDYYEIIIPSNTEVLITIDKIGASQFRMFGGNVTIKEVNEEGKETLKIQSDKAKYILISKSKLDIESSNNVIVEGNVSFNDVSIETENLEFKDVVVDAKYFYHHGHRLFFNNVNGIVDFASMETENITIESSSLKSKYLNIIHCYKPTILNSRWYLSSNLYYINESIRYKNGITIDDKTFSGKESVDLGRAYAIYCLKQVLKKVKEINNEELIFENKIIDSEIERIKQQYEEKRKTIEKSYQKRKVKSIIQFRNIK